MHNTYTSPCKSRSQVAVRFTRGAVEALVALLRGVVVADALLAVLAREAGITRARARLLLGVARAVAAAVVIVIALAVLT